MAGYNYMNGGYYANKAGYVATPTGRVVEHVLAPVVVTEYQYISQSAKVESTKNYGVSGDKWRRPSNPAHDRPQVVVTEIGYGSPIPEAEPVKNYGVTGDKLRRTSNPAHDRPQVAVTEIGYGSLIPDVEPEKNYEVTREKWRRPSNPVYDRPQVVVTEYGYGSPTIVEPMKDSGVTGLYRPPEVEEFITKVQTEASRLTRPGVLSATNWRNVPNSVGQGGNTGYGEYTNYNSSDNWNKPSGNTVREPTITNTLLSGPRNDIGKAMEIPKETVKPSFISATAPPQPRFAAPASTVPKGDAYADVIDSREAARRYGNFHRTSRPFQTGETYTGTIDSNEAARKYDGTLV